MRRLKKYLFPLFTALAVLAAVLLPRRLSQAGDRRLLGQVHTEAAETGETRFLPASTLLQRIDLLARWQLDLGVSSMIQDLAPESAAQDPEPSGAGGEEDGAYTSGRLRETASFALVRLFDYIPPLDDLFSAPPSDVIGQRLLLQDPETGLSANLLYLHWEDLRSGGKAVRYVSMILDEESGLVLSLCLQDRITVNGKSYDIVTHGAEDLGQLKEMALLYLNYLGIDGALRFTLENLTVTYQLDKGPVLYRFLSGLGTLNIEPWAYEKDGVAISGGDPGSLAETRAK